MLLVLFIPIYRALSGATSPATIVDLGAIAMKGYSAFPKAPALAGTSPPDCLVSYPGHSFEGVLLLSREAVGVFYSPSRLGNITLR